MVNTSLKRYSPQIVAMVSEKDQVEQKAIWFEQLQQSLASLDGQLMLMLSLSEWTTDETRHVHLGAIQGGRDIPTGRKEYCNSLEINSAQLNGEITYSGEGKVNIPMVNLHHWEGYNFTLHGGPIPAKSVEYRFNPEEMTNLTFHLSSGKYVSVGKKPVLLWNGYQLNGREKMSSIHPNHLDSTLELVLVGNTFVSNFFGVENCTNIKSLFTAYAKSQGYDKALLNHWQDSLRRMEDNPEYNGKNCDGVSPQARDIINKIRNQDLPNRVVHFNMYSELGIPKPSELPRLEKLSL